MTSPKTEARVAVILPCHNEAGAIGQVVDAFRQKLPQAEIHVFDNASTDRTSDVARSHGAIVHHVSLRGKGNVVRRMFADVEAEVYLMTDGDATYDLANIQSMVDGVLVHGNDMVVGVRQDDGDARNYRAGHRLGNRLLTGSVMWLFGGAFTDMLSGHRAFSRRYVKSFPAAAHGFETETELTVHALALRMAVAETPVAYGSRPEGTVSKLSTYRDGLKILRTILWLFTSERPLSFFILVSFLLGATSLGLAVPVVMEYLTTGLVPRQPTTVLATGLMICSGLSLMTGVLLHHVATGRQEAKRLAYLAIPASRR